MTKFLGLLIDLCPVSISLTLKLLKLTSYSHLTSYEVSILKVILNSNEKAVVKEKDKPNQINRAITHMLPIL